MLEARGVTVARSLVGTYVTSLDMAGCSITVTRSTTRCTRLWDAPVHTAALRWGMWPDHGIACGVFAGEAQYHCSAGFVHAFCPDNPLKHLSG